MDEASQVFQKTLQDFPSSLEVHKCQYKLVLVAFFKGDNEAARRRFTDLAENPNGPLAAEAKAFADFLSKRGQLSEKPIQEAH